MYAKMNHHLLGDLEMAGVSEQGFESLLDFVDEMHENELVQQSKGGVQNDQTAANPAVRCDSPSSSGSGGADSW